MHRNAMRMRLIKKQVTRENKFVLNKSFLRKSFKTSGIILRNEFYIIYNIYIKNKNKNLYELQSPKGV
jgi:hypothetical protein